MTPVPMFKKIVIATDGSPSSQDAYALGGTIAKGYGSDVVVLSVIPSMSALSAPLGGKYYAVQVDKAKAIVEFASQALGKEGVVVAKTETLQGNASAAETIVDYASSTKTELVIMGTRGLGGLKRALLGSVSSAVASASPCSTLVVRNQGGKAPGTVGRILVAVDGSDSAQMALSAAVDIAKQLKATLEVAHAAHISGTLWAVGVPGSTVPSEEIEEDVIKRGDELLAKAAAFVEAQGLPNPKTYMLTNISSPAQGICELAEREGEDLIVTGSRGLAGFKRVLLGSVADGVLHYAPCSVLIVR